MNPDPLSSYKEKAYNLGSPRPDPVQEQFGNFPLKKSTKAIPKFNSSATDPLNPLRLTFSATKRKHSHISDSEEGESSPKQLKMDEKALKLLNSMAENQTKIFDKFDQQNTKIDLLTDSIKDFKDFKGETQTRLATVEGDIDEIKNKLAEGIGQADIEKIAALLPDLKETFGADFKSQINNAHKAKLAKECWDHDHAMVIHGLKTTNCSETEIRTFLKDKMKVPEDYLEKVKIKDIFKLGRGNAEKAKPPPISVKFGHPSQRNTIITYSKHLEKGLDVDKSVPKAYQSTYKDFKKEGWKLRTVHELQTQIIFIEHKMILRYKIKDSPAVQYSYTIAREYDGPEPGAVQAASGNRLADNQAGKLPTPRIPMTASDAASRAVIVTKIQSELSQQEIKAKFNEYFAEEVAAEIVKEITPRSNRAFLVICNNWNSCNDLITKYKKSAFLGHIPTFTLVNETDPN